MRCFKNIFLVSTLLLLFLLSSCSKEKIECRILPSVEKVESYENFAASCQTNIALAKAESEHFQIVFKGTPGEVYTITRHNETPDIQFNCRRIESINGFNDVLVPFGSEIELTDSVAKLWVTYKTNYATVPGNYTEKLIIKGDDKEQEIKVNITVYDVELPVTPTIPATFGIIEEKLEKNYSAANLEKAKLQWADLCLDYRMNPYFSTWLEESMKHEASSSPWKWDDERTYKFLSDERFNRYALPYHSLSKGELKNMLETYNEKGMLNDAYFYLWDEPVLMSEYAQIKKFANDIHQVAPNAKVLTTFFCGPKDGKYKDNLWSVFDLWRGDTQIYSMSAWALHTTEANADTCRMLLKDNEEWWTYVCMGPGGEEPNLLLSMSGYQNRAVMWRSWKEKTTGFLYWAVNAYADEKTLEFRTDLPEGDGVLIYPGEHFGVSEPVVSIRMERWRDSMEDYELLVQLEQKIGRAKAESIFGNIYTAPDNYTDNYLIIDKFRNSVLDILKN
ncbi:DUF4091 domain-containing protein [Paludibacter sp. 221]|uniref:DUF4091 domain-containing protein n=1 Tax=Paludibacter sp. 221 TaxID=2302939 RepID=UPI0013D0765C|nr:DUF4091 domain-containing protein [Paludibacter sp. 221]NDV46591.1 DUF4091 domain-containing protein [Paludibacter sp. 221]